MALTQTQVSQLYVSVFGRASEGDGNTYWQTDQADMVTTANVMLATDAAATYFGTTLDDDQAFIEHIYLNTLGKTYAQDTAGVDYWVSELTAGKSKGEVVTALINAAQATENAGDAQDQFNNKVAVSDYTADTISTFTTIADFTAFIANVDETDASVTTAKTAVDAAAPATGETFTLTTGTDTIVMTTGDDTVDGSTPNSFTALDRIDDSSTDDNDTLNITLSTANVQATVKNVENVNVTWTSNNTIALDTVNSTGNTYNLSANGLAFNGNATITDAGINDFNAGDDVNGTLTLTNAIATVVDAGSAKNITVDGGTVTTVGQKTTADITVNNNITTLTNTVGDEVDQLTISATDAVTIGLAAGAIDDSLTVSGSNDITLTGAVTNEKIVNSLTDAELTVNSTDVGLVSLTSIDADLINFKAAATAVTVADNQSLGVVSGGSLTSIVAKAGLTNVTADLTSSVDIAALDVTAISNFNMQVTEDLTVTALTTDADNNVTIVGAGDLTLTSVGVAAVDASGMTGKLDYTSGAAATGVIGSSTAANTFTISALVANNGTVVGGAADDTVNIAAALTGTLSIDGGAGDDTLVLTHVNAVSGAKTTITNVEEIQAVTNIVFTEAQLSGEDYNFTEQTGAGSANLVVNVANASGASAVTTDLSKLTFTDTVNKDFSTTAITGVDNAVDTITATALNDTIDGGLKADVINIGDGQDNILIDDTAGDSTEAAMDAITGFDAVSASGSENDVLTFTTAASTVGTVAAASAASAVKGGTGGEAVSVESVSGVMALTGTDASLINELSEYIDAAQLVINGAGETIVFEFGGDTYVVSDGASAATTDDAIVQLVGVTGVTAVAAAAAADTIVVA